MLLLIEFLFTVFLLSTALYRTYSAVPKTKEGCAPCKYIHVMRHPKDICVSMYYHMTGFTIYDYKGPFSEFFDLFIHGLGKEEEGRGYFSLTCSVCDAACAPVHIHKSLHTKLKSFTRTCTF